MKIILIIIMVTAPLAASAQINIDEYRESVIEYSYTLKKSVAEIDYASEIYSVKRSRSLPSLTLSGGVTQQLKRSDNNEGWSFDLQPQLSQTIYNGGAIEAETRSAELGVRVAELDAEYNRLDVCYSADYNYYYLAAMAMLKGAVDQYVEIVSSLKEVVKLRYDEGYISKGDLLMIEARLGEAQYQQTAIGEDYTLALHKFNMLRGSDIGLEVVLQVVDVYSVVVPKRVSIEELLEYRPDFLAALLTVEQAQSSVDITKASYNPSLSVGIAGNWGTKLPNINGSTAINGSVFLKLSSPLFRFGERRHAVNAARSLKASSDIAVLELIDEIKLAEGSTWAKIIDSRAQLDAAQQALEIGAENLDISTFAYSEGLTTILDVMQSQISWLQLYSNSIWSEFSYLVSLAEYRRIAVVDNL